MDDRINELILFPVWPLPETAMGVLCNCLVGALLRRLRDTIFPLGAEQKFSTPNKWYNFTASYDRPKIRRNGTLVV